MRCSLGWFAAAAVVLATSSSIAQVGDRRISSDLLTRELPPGLRSQAAVANGTLTVVALSSCRPGEDSTAIGEIHVRIFRDTVPAGAPRRAHDTAARPTGRFAVVAFGAGFLLFYNDDRADSTRLSLSILDSAGALVAAGSVEGYPLRDSLSGAVAVDATGGTIWWRSTVANVPVIVLARIRADGSIDGEPVVTSTSLANVYEPAALGGGAILTLGGDAFIAAPGRQPRPAPAWLTGNFVVDDRGQVHTLRDSTLRSYASLDAALPFDSATAPVPGAEPAAMVTRDSDIAAFWFTATTVNGNAMLIHSHRARFSSSPLRLLATDTVRSSTVACRDCYGPARFVSIRQGHGCAGSALLTAAIRRPFYSQGQYRADTVVYYLAALTPDSTIGAQGSPSGLDCTRATPTTRRSWIDTSVVDVRIGSNWCRTSVVVPQHLLRRSSVQPCLCVQGDSLLGVWKIPGEYIVAGVHHISRGSSAVDLIAATAGYSHSFSTSGRWISSPTGSAGWPIRSAGCAVPGTASVSVRLSWPPGYTWDGTATTYFVSFPHVRGWSTASWGVGPSPYSFPGLSVSSPMMDPTRGELAVYMRATETGRTIAQGLAVFAVDGRRLRDEQIHPDSLTVTDIVAPMTFGPREALIITESVAVSISATGRPGIRWAAPGRAGYLRIAGDEFIRGWHDGDVYYIEVYDSARTLRAARQITVGRGAAGAGIAQVPSDSSFLLFWPDAGVLGLRLSRRLEPVGDIFRVSATTGRVEAPCVGFIGDTAYVAWVDYRSPLPNIYMAALPARPLRAATPIPIAAFPSFTVAPIPAADVAYVTLDTPASGARLTLIDATSRVVLTSEFPPGVGTLAMSTAGLPTGTYTIRVVSPSGVSTKRCIIVH